MTPALSVLLLYDYLLSKGGIAAPKAHPLVIAITKHKARLGAEFTRIRLQHGFATVEAFKGHVNARMDRTLDGAEHEQAGDSSHRASAVRMPRSRVRWTRINTLCTSQEEQMRTTFCDHELASSLTDLIKTSSTSAKIGNVVFLDPIVPNLIAVPRWIDLSKTPAYQRGHLILQDKASCFPALLLDVPAFKGDVIDACAAPGNKTTQIAAILQALHPTGLMHRRIWAIERDRERAETLQKMVTRANAGTLVSVRAGQDFLQLDPRDEQWQHVEALLLDPSCTGSGMTNRAAPFNFTLPKRAGAAIRQSEPRRGTDHGRARESISHSAIAGQADERGMEDTYAPHRLEALSAFQLKILTHSFRFPSASRVVYSTCSVHAAENEHVVVKALSSAEAVKHGWRILKREQQVPSLRDWHLRGDAAAVEEVMANAEQARAVADACIRCDMNGPDATIGFFVAGFIRGLPDTTEAASSMQNNGAASFEAGVSDDVDEEWNGFTDVEDD